MALPTVCQSGRLSRATTRGATENSANKASNIPPSMKIVEAPTPAPETGDGPGRDATNRATPSATDTQV